MLKKYLLKHRYYPGGIPYVSGNRSWSYIKKPKGFRWFFKRPLVKLNPDGFSYFYQGRHELRIPGGDESDTHTIPWPFVIGTFGLIRYAPEGLVWVAFAHDRACKQKWNSKEMRADLYRESIWFAYDGLKAELKHSNKHWLKKSLLKQYYRTQNVLLIGGVKLGSVTGAC